MKKKKIKWLAILIAGVAINANAFISTYGGSITVDDGTKDNIIGDGGSYSSLTGDYLIVRSDSALTVATNGTVTVMWNAVIGSSDSNSRLVLQSGSTMDVGGNVNVGTGSGATGNVLEIQRGATVSIASGKDINIGSGGSTGNSLILGDDISGFGEMMIFNGNTLVFDGGTSASDLFYFFSGALVEITGSYGVGDELVAADYANGQNWNNILDAFNAAGASKGYVFDLTTADATGANSIIVAAVPEPASIMMAAAGLGIIITTRRLRRSKK